MSEAVIDNLKEILRKEFPVLARMIYNPIESKLREILNHHIEAVLTVSKIELDEAVQSYAKTCFEFMTLQNQFLDSGRYAANSQITLEQEIYSKPETMQRYLVGLLLTYAWWENHFKILNYFFETKNTLETGDKILEIGVGHGLFAELMDLSNSSTSYIGVDISQSSIDLASAISKMGPKNSLIRFFLADATKENTLPEQWATFSICCEVLEHVDDPIKLLNNIRSSMQNEGIMFLTTVCNLEAIDHIYQFRDVESVREVIVKAGFDIISEVNLELPGTSGHNLMQSNYAAFLKKAF